MQRLLRQTSLCAMYHRARDELTKGGAMGSERGVRSPVTVFRAAARAAVPAVLASALGIACAGPARSQDTKDGVFRSASARSVEKTIQHEGIRHSQNLPDWSGVWAQVGNTVFDDATVQPPGGSANRHGTREYPPFTAAWERTYESNLKRVAEDEFPDPITNCGVPVGFPRIFNLPDVYEFVVRPEQTWILTENGPNVLRIYTDGRLHPQAKDLWLTYSGDSVGYWDRDTLVFSTIAVKNEGTILDRTGLTLSNDMTAVTRIRKVAKDRIELDMVLEDPVALKQPWRVKMQYRKLPAGTRVYDYACAENNRNPVTGNGLTITLGPNGKPLTRSGTEDKGDK